jgi:hypothetical protein
MVEGKKHMKYIEEIKAQSAAHKSFWSKAWLSVVALCAILDMGFGLDWAISILVAMIIPFNLFRAARVARINGDQYAIFSEYRLYAITLSCAFVSVLLTEELKKAGLEIRLSTVNVLLLSAAAALVGLTIFDYLFGKGDAE